MTVEAMTKDTAAFVFKFGPSGSDHAAYVPLPTCCRTPGTFRVRYGEGLCRVGPAPGPQRRSVKRARP